MALLKRAPLLTFSVLVSLLSLSAVVLTPLLSYTANEGLAVTVPLGYCADAISVIAPFLTLGAMAYAFCEGGMARAFRFFSIFTLVKVFVAFPLSIIVYSEALSSPYALVLLVYIFSAISEAALLLLVFWIGTLLFGRGERTHEARFLGSDGTDARVLLFSVAVVAVEDILRFVFSFIEHLKEKLWIFDAKDIEDIFISLLFIAACAFLSFLSGRFSARLFEE